MQEPATPADEALRQEALNRLHILDTSAEERFDRYTRLAQRLFDVPIALVSLVDSNRQWFKSRQGLEATQTARDISFCGHAILDSEVFVIEDAGEDQRFCDNPLVTENPNIRFYAGCPLIGPGGHRLGTLCIIDVVPREMSEEDLDALRDLGAMVSSELSALELATLDELTGISNRRGFDVLARQALAACRRGGQSVALVVIDLDGFKQINDEFGHAEGDHALHEFTRLMLETFRDSDVIARTGGDEFCVLLAGAGEATVQEAVDRLTDVVRTRNQFSPSRYVLAFSAGVVEHSSRRPSSVPRLLAEADRRMYRQKKGRPAA